MIVFLTVTSIAVAAIAFPLRQTVEATVTVLIDGTSIPVACSWLVYPVRERRMHFAHDFTTDDEQPRPDDSIKALC